MFIGLGMRAFQGSQGLPHIAVQTGADWENSDSGTAGPDPFDGYSVAPPPKFTDTSMCDME